MKELFDPKGHLTDDALRYLINGELEELNRLEVSEHLSFCDECILRYTQVLTDDCLIAPPEPMVESIMHRIRKRARVIFFNKYVTMGAAASFAIVFWVNGIFTVNMNTDQDRIIDGISNSAAAFSERTVEITEKFTESITKIFNQISLEGVFNNEKK